MKTKSLIQFVAIVYLLSWSLQLVAIFFTEGISSDTAEIFLVLTMFIPALVTIVLLIRNKSLRSQILWKPNRKLFITLFLGVVIPTLSAFGVVIIISALGYGTSGWFEFASTGVTTKGGPWILGLGYTNWFLFVANIFITGLAYSLISGVPAAAEEFVWRGFLQSVLIDKLGMTKGIIVLGTIWSFWHLPALLAGYNHPDYPILGSFILQPIKEIAISFFLAWLTLSCKSFLAAAIAHGAGNSIQEGIISNITLSGTAIYRDIVDVLVTICIGFLFYFLLKKKEDQLVEYKNK